MNELTLASGVFDLFHVGHLRYLQQARALATGPLLVGVVSDAETQRVKGRLPLIAEQQRLEWVSALGGVDAARLQPTSTTNIAEAVDWIQAWGVTQVIQGDTWQPSPAGQALENALKQCGIKVRYLPTTACISSAYLRQQLAVAPNSAVCPELPSNSQLDLPLKPKQANRIRVLATGVFDLPHHGHLRFLQQAAQQGDELLVGVASDQLTYANKGRYPVFTGPQRRELLQGLKCVDATLTIEQSLRATKPSVAWIEALKVDRLVGCTEWQKTGHWQRLESALKQKGMEVIYLPPTPDISTSMLRQRIVAPLKAPIF